MATPVAPHEHGFAATRVQISDPSEADRLDYGPLLHGIRKSFFAGKTQPLAWRKEQLTNLKQGILDMHEELTAAIRADLGGPKIRGIGEITAIDAIDHVLASLDKWAAPQSVPNTTMENPNGSAEIRPQPKGVVLLISPWNYPIGLCLHPLVSVIASGNCCVIKPSEVAVNSSFATKRLLEKYLDPACYRVVLGGVAETTALLRERFDHIVYTGNGDVARIIMAAAAKHLTPCTLELGGKSPVIIDKTANLSLAARRVAMGKWGINAGQTCIAPDYVLVDRKVQDQFIAELKKVLRSYFGGSGAQTSADYGKIINSRHVGRLERMLSQSQGGQIVLGNPGEINSENCFIPPIIIKDPSFEDAIMREEIFGPFLPVLGVDGIEEALEIVHRVCCRPLALYQFTADTSVQQYILNHTQSGGAVVNGCNFEQYINANLPFGGIGESGTGELNGINGFRQFSHNRGVVHKSTSWPFTKLDLPAPPYKDSLYDQVVKLKYTGFLSENQRSIIKRAGIGAAVLLSAAVLRSRL